MCDCLTTKIRHVECDEQRIDFIWDTSQAVPNGPKLKLNVQSAGGRARDGPGSDYDNSCTFCTEVFGKSAKGMSRPVRCLRCKTDGDVLSH
eukprot:4458614-Amphidinium_carterae.2